jgi:hypothetical protein
MTGLRAAGRGLLLALAVAALIGGGAGVVGSVIYGAVDYVADHSHSTKEAAAGRPEAFGHVVEVGIKAKEKLQ